MPDSFFSQVLFSILSTFTSVELSQLYIFSCSSLNNHIRFYSAHYTSVCMQCTYYNKAIRSAAFFSEQGIHTHSFIHFFVLKKKRFLYVVPTPSGLLPKRILTFLMDQKNRACIFHSHKWKSGIEQTFVCVCVWMCAVIITVFTFFADFSPKHFFGSEESIFSPGVAH